MRPLNTDRSRWRYRTMIGVGGIGSGTFFAINGNHTLGREESRSGRFLDRRDYCKLHIISHYVRTLLGPAFATIPIGRVGDDDVGRVLRSEMQATGLDLRYVDTSPGSRTLYSICFIYPDGSGGNLTTDVSASSGVSAASVRRAEPEFRTLAGRGVALAAPEVPLEARQALLELGTANHFFRAASFTSEEMQPAMRTGLLSMLDLLAINVDEAAAVLGTSPEGEPPAEVAAAAAGELARPNPRLLVTITAGTSGSWLWDGTSLTHAPAVAVPVASTAGAGDAYLAGMIVATVAGLTATDAQQLATLVAALSVVSPHTINSAIDRESLRSLAEESRVGLSAAVWRLLAD